MPRYLISYDITKDSKITDKDMECLLGKYGAQHVQGSVWAVRSQPDMLEELYSGLRQFVDDKDSLLVAEIHGVREQNSKTRVTDALDLNSLGDND